MNTELSMISPSPEKPLLKDDSVWKNTIKNWDNIENKNEYYKIISAIIYQSEEYLNNTTEYGKTFYQDKGLSAFIIGMFQQNLDISNKTNIITEEGVIWLMQKISGLLASITPLFENEKAIAQVNELIISIKDLITSEDGQTTISLETLINNSNQGADAYDILQINKSEQGLSSSVLDNLASKEELEAKPGKKIILENEEHKNQPIEIFNFYGNYTEVDEYIAPKDNEQFINYNENSYGSHIEGFRHTLVNAPFSHIEGRDAIAGGKNVHIEGSGWATDETSDGEISGGFHAAYGDYSHVEGVQNISYGQSCHAEGRHNIVGQKCFVGGKIKTNDQCIPQIPPDKKEFRIAHFPSQYLLNILKNSKENLKKDENINISQKLYNKYTLNESNIIEIKPELEFIFKEPATVFFRGESIYSSRYLKTIYVYAPVNTDGSEGELEDLIYLSFEYKNNDEQYIEYWNDETNDDLKEFIIYWPTRQIGDYAGWGNHSHVNGFNNQACGNKCFVTGENNVATGSEAFVAGQYNTCHNNESAVFGQHNTSSRDCQMVIGQYNEPTSTDLFVIGNGNHDNRRNVFSVNEEGIIHSKGTAYFDIPLENYVRKLNYNYEGNGQATVVTKSILLHSKYDKPIKIDISSNSGSYINTYSYDLSWIDTTGSNFIRVYPMGYPNYYLEFKYNANTKTLTVQIPNNVNTRQQLNKSGMLYKCTIYTCSQ